MHYSTIILALSTAASALNIRLYAQGNCGGGYTACVNISSSVCCTHNNQYRYPSIGFVSISSGWNVNLKGFIGGACTSLAKSTNNARSASVCLNGTTTNYLSGGAYTFNSKRNLLPRVAEQCAADDASGACQASVKPDLFVLEDGTEYALPDMPKPLADTLVCTYHAASDLICLDVIIASAWL